MTTTVSEAKFLPGQRVPRALLGSLCALSGHIGHERDCFGNDRPRNANGGWFCLPESKYAKAQPKGLPR